jgi:hypothetical protein
MPKVLLGSPIILHAKLQSLKAILAQHLLFGGPL